MFGVRALLSSVYFFFWFFDAQLKTALMLWESRDLNPFETVPLISFILIIPLSFKMVRLSNQSQGIRICYHLGVGIVGGDIIRQQQEGTYYYYSY